MQRVAFQGELGSYSQDAARRFFQNGVEALPLSTFNAVFGAVETGRAEYGIIPVENSLVGSIHQNYDLLLKHDLKVAGEQNLRIIHALIAPAETSLAELERVYSHPMALEQCRQFLESHPQLQPVATYDTAGSVKLIKEEGQQQSSAIASRYAAKLYGMKVVADAIQDEPENYTRFLILSRQEAKETDDCKTSVVFVLKNLPGALFKALSVFALRDLDLTKIESRPFRQRTWQYYFYLDFIGHVRDEAPGNAITHLREITTYLKILGSYPICRAHLEQE